MESIAGHSPETSLICARGARGEAKKRSLDIQPAFPICTSNISGQRCYGVIDYLIFDLTFSWDTSSADDDADDADDDDPGDGDDHDDDDADEDDGADDDADDDDDDADDDVADDDDDDDDEGATRMGQGKPKGH